MRGQYLRLLSRELGVTGADLSGRRVSPLAVGAASLKSRPENSWDRRLRAMSGKIGELTMVNELLEAKIDRMDGGRPVGLRSSRK